MATVEGGGEAEKKASDPALVDLHKKIEEAFDVFDHHSNKTVDVR